jgi:TfoX/Sxy family transcriptional regulator of competence genes
MAYNQELAGRIRQITEDHILGEKVMFGGISFLLHGNMACGVIGEELIVRVGPDAFPEAMQRQGARVFDFTGKPMTGWVKVAPEGIANEQDLREWIHMGLAFAASLPPK